MASRDLRDLEADIRLRAIQWVDLCRARGVEVLIYCTHRSHVEQARLYRQGRSTSMLMVRVDLLRMQADDIDSYATVVTKNLTSARAWSRQTGDAAGESDGAVVSGYLNAQADAIIQVGPQRGSRRLTNALPWASAHNYGMAFDAAPWDGGKLVWNSGSRLYDVMGAEAKEAGLEWAGTWRSFRESVHFQLPEWQDHGVQR